MLYYLLHAAVLYSSMSCWPGLCTCLAKARLQTTCRNHMAEHSTVTTVRYPLTEGHSFFFFTNKSSRLSVCMSGEHHPTRPSLLGRRGGQARMLGNFSQVGTSCNELLYRVYESTQNCGFFFLWGVLKKRMVKNKRKRQRGKRKKRRRKPNENETTPDSPRHVWASLLLCSPSSSHTTQVGGIPESNKRSTALAGWCSDVIGHLAPKPTPQLR